MKKLVVDARMINASGIGRYLKELLPYIVNKFETTLIGDEREIKKFEWSKKVKIINSNAPIYSVKEQIELFKKIPETDIFWSPHYNIPVLPVKAKKRVVTIHDVYHLAFKSTLTVPQKIYAEFMIKQAVKKSDVIITVSEFSRNEILKYTNTKKSISVVYNGINKKYFRNTLKSGEKEKYILYVGNVKPHKNLVRALEAFKKLNLKNFRFMIVGEKENFITKETRIEKIARELGDKVIFTGYINDENLIDVYQKAYLFLFPSLYEGFGFPPLEAMACGTPVVVSNAASLPEICGDAAYYVNPYEIEDIAQGIKKVLEDVNLRNKLIEKGIQRAKSFNWENSANRIISLLNS